MARSGTTMANTALLSDNFSMFNDSHDHRGLDLHPDPWSAVAVTEGITFLIIFVGALFTNLMAMTTILLEKTLRNNLHNVLILNLIVMDLGTTITSMPFSIWSIYDHGALLTHNDVLCTINGFLDALFCLGNFMTVLAISLDRYLAVCWSTRFPPTKHRTIALVLLCWIVPIIDDIFPVLHIESDFKYVPNAHHCFPIWDECVYFTVFFFSIIGFIVPIMAFCYISIMLTTRRQELKMKSHQRALGRKSSDVRNAGTTSNSDVGNISMDTMSISQTVNLTDDRTGVPTVGQSDLPDTGVMNDPGVTGDDVSDDVSYQPSGSRDDAHVVAEQRAGRTAEDPAQSTGKATKSIWNKRKRAKNVLASLNKLSVDKQIAMTGLLLVLTTLVCWVPWFIIHSCFHTTNPPHWVGVVSMCLGYTNSLLDPLIYAFMNRRLRARYRSLIGCRDCAR